MERQELSMMTLGSGERLAEIPAGFRQGTHDLKEHNGIFCGRENELRQLREYFGDQWLAENQGAAGDGPKATRGFAHIITNAPGAGKSALLVEFALRQTLRGIACPLLQFTDFENPQAIIEALHDYARTNSTGVLPLWLQEPVRWAIENEDMDRLAALGFASAGDLIGAATAKLTIPGLQKIGKKMMELFNATPPRTVAHALQRLSKATDGKFIIMVDECHNWVLPDADRKTIREHISTIADKKVRASKGIRGGGLLAAGLGSVTRKEDELGLTRAGTTWLGALSLEESETAIRRTIQAAATSTERKQRVLNEWSVRLAEEFGGWPQHMAAAAVTAKTLLQATHQGSDDGDRATLAARDAKHLEWVRTMAADMVGKLYSDRIGAAVDTVGNWAAPTLAALATLHHDRIPIGAVHEALALSVANDRSRSENEKPSRQEAFMRVLGSGLVRYCLIPGTTKTDHDHMEVAMPSLRSYITETTEASSPDKVAMAHRMAQQATKTASEMPALEDTANNDDSAED